MTFTNCLNIAIYFDFHRSLEIYFWFLLISDITLQFLYFTLGQNSISNLINQREGNLR